MRGYRPRVVALPEREKLHEQPLVGSLGLSVPESPFFAQVWGLDARAAGRPGGRVWRLTHVVWLSSAVVHGVKRDQINLLA